MFKLKLRGGFGDICVSTKCEVADCVSFYTDCISGLFMAHPGLPTDHRNKVRILLNTFIHTVTMQQLNVKTVDCITMTIYI